MRAQDLFRSRRRRGKPVTDEVFKLGKQSSTGSRAGRATSGQLLWYVIGGILLVLAGIAMVAGVHIRRAFPLFVIGLGAVVVVVGLTRHRPRLPAFFLSSGRSCSHSGAFWLPVVWLALRMG